MSWSIKYWKLATSFVPEILKSKPLTAVHLIDGVHKQVLFRSDSWFPFDNSWNLKVNIIHRLCQKCLKSECPKHYYSSRFPINNSKTPKWIWKCLRSECSNHYYYWLPLLKPLSTVALFAGLHIKVSFGFIINI